MRRTLALKKECLTELTAHEMRGVAAGRPLLPTKDECYYVSDTCVPSFNPLCLISRAMYPCPTEPTLICD